MLRLRGKAVLGGLRKVWPVTPSADLESWISATAVSECVCVCLLILGRKQDKEAKTFIKTPGLSLITYFWMLYFPT